MPIILSLGELIDRLAICHLKQWHLEEQMNDPDISDEAKVKITDQIVSLNQFRMKLIDAIDEYAENNGS